MADIFCLTDNEGNILPPSVQSTVLAKYSRSSLSAREIVKSLTPEESDKFQDKWVISYGHSSVSELSTLPICLEGVSIIASKFIESYQRPGYSEKSTRYQKFSSESFIVPPGAPQTMKTFSQRFYNAYDKFYPKMLRITAKLLDKDPNDINVLNDRVVKARAFDNLRYLLPAGTGTSLGIVACGRDLRHFVRSSLGHTNPEIRYIGENVKGAIEKICPVFMKGIEPDSFEPPVKNLGVSQNNHRQHPKWSVSLYKPNLLPSPELVQATMESLIVDQYGMSWTEFCDYMNSRGDRSVPKIFRNFRLKFHIMMDYGAYRDLQRHRRCEQYAEPLTTNYGFLVPDDIIGTELEEEYSSVMESACDFNDESVIYDPDLSQYPVPLGYLHRSVFDVDLEELYYMVELRTRPSGHISYRRVAYKMYEIALSLYPRLMQFCRAVYPSNIGEHR